MRPLARLALLASTLLLASSASCTSSNMGKACPPARGSCACGGDTPGRQMVDGCTSAPVSACECPTIEPCKLTDGSGTRACFGADCGDCYLSLSDGKALWTANGTGDAVAFAPTVDGGAYVLMRSAPWMARFDATGKPLPFTVHETLEWVRAMAADVDGSVILLGLADRMNGSPPGPITVKRLDTAGVTVATTAWGTKENTYVVGAVLSQGKDVLVGSTQGARIVVGRVGADTTVVQVGALEDGGAYKAIPTSLVAGPKGEILLASSSWVALMSPAGVLVAEAPYPAVVRSVALNALGEVYVGGTVDTTTAFLSRLDQNLAVLWTKKLARAAVRTVLALPDGVLGLDGAPWRLDRLGGLVGQQPFTPFPTYDVQPAGDHQVLFLTRGVGGNNEAIYGIGRGQIGDAPFPVGPQAVAAPCFADVDCTSAHCCTDGKAGKCSETAVCPVGSRCTSDATCVGGVCTKSEAAREGTCMTPCTATAQCPAAQVCAPRACGLADCPTACLPSCTTPASCNAFAGNLVCSMGNTTEQQAASFCR